ncbi:hypothetical protein D3C71_1096400 [compost metagenome]
MVVEEGQCERHRHRQHQPAGKLAAGRADLTQRRFGVVQHASAVRVELLTSLGKLHASRGTSEQAAACPLLEMHDVLVHHRWRVVEIACRRGEPARLDNATEALQSQVSVHESLAVSAPPPHALPLHRHDDESVVEGERQHDWQHHVVALQLRARERC